MSFTGRICVLYAVLGCAVVSHAAGPVEGARVYSAPGGMQVTVVTLSSGSPQKEAILLITHSGGYADGKAILHTVAGAEYQTVLRGHSRTTLRNERDLYPPGVRGPIAVTLDPKATQQVDAQAIYQLHERQKKEGALAELARIDRKAEQTKHDAELATALAKLNAACGTKVTATIEWSTLADEHLQTTIPTPVLCSYPLTAIEGLCGSRTVQSTLQKQLKAFVCATGPALKLEEKGGEARFTIGPRPAGTPGWEVEVARMSTDWATNRLFKDAAGASAAPLGVAVPWGRGTTLGEKQALDDTRVCTDGKSHYVVVGPTSRRGTDLLVGDGKTFTQVRTPPANVDGAFVDPRFFRKKTDPATGLLSEVILEGDGCAVRCGERTRDLKRVDADASRAMLLKARYQPNPQGYEPHALLRDPKGVYFLVERGIRPDTDKSFRLHIGPKGNLREQKMINVVADTEGEVFTTRDGELRLVVDRKLPGYWIAGDRKIKLRSVPVKGENLPLIYNDLGVYLGQRLGTPCDDFS